MTGPVSDVAVVVLLHGRVVRDGGRILEASSSVTLVESHGHRIVVDTGSPEAAPELVEALESRGVSADSIEHVVNTHFHVDHTGNNGLFEKARIVAHQLESPPIGTLRISGRTLLVPNVELVPTPGHSHGSISAFVTANKKYAICGDAIPTRGNYEQHTPPSVNIDRSLALKSLDMICAWADVVIPGHDAQFDVRGKK